MATAPHSAASRMRRQVYRQTLANDPNSLKKLHRVKEGRKPMKTAPMILGEGGGPFQNFSEKERKKNREPSDTQGNS